MVYGALSKPFLVPLNAFSALHVSFNTPQSWEGKERTAAETSKDFSHIHTEAKEDRDASVTGTNLISLVVMYVL